MADGNGGSRPVPDPTVLTTDQTTRFVQAERDYVDAQLDVLRERLAAIDKATELLNETVNRVPTDVQKEVTHLRELSEEKFRSIEQQFKERDTRSERESRDNTVAVDAAFAAQKEAASEQNKSNTLAINKSEEGTKETIAKLSELFKTTTDALAGKIDDNKERIGELAQLINGYASHRVGAKEDRSGLYATVGIGITVLLAIIAVIGFIAARGGP